MKHALIATAALAAATLAFAHKQVHQDVPLGFHECSDTTYQGKVCVTGRASTYGATFTPDAGVRLIELGDFHAFDSPTTGQTWAVDTTHSPKLHAIHALHHGDLWLYQWANLPAAGDSAILTAVQADGNYSVWALDAQTNTLRRWTASMPEGKTPIDKATTYEMRRFAVWAEDVKVSVKLAATNLLGDFHLDTAKALAWVVDRSRRRVNAYDATGTVRYKRNLADNKAPYGIWLDTSTGAMYVGDMLSGLVHVYTIPDTSGWVKTRDFGTLPGS